MKFANVLRAEFGKLKRSYAWVLMVAAPLLMVLFGASNFTRYRERFLRGASIPWDEMLFQVVFFYGLLLLPLSIGVLSVWLARIEHSENNWKHLLALPVGRGSIYSAKTVVHVALIGLSMAVLYVGLVVAGKTLAVGSVPYWGLSKSVFAAWVACLPILAAQMWLSVRYTSISVPIGVSLGASVAGIFAINSQYGAYYPWSLPTLALVPGSVEIRPVSPAYSLAVSVLAFAVVFALAMRDFGERDVQ